MLVVETLQAACASHASREKTTIAAALTHAFTDQPPQIDDQLVASRDDKRKRARFPLAHERGFVRPRPHVLEIELPSLPPRERHFRVADFHPDFEIFHRIDLPVHPAGERPGDRLDSLRFEVYQRSAPPRWGNGFHHFGE